MNPNDQAILKRYTTPGDPIAFSGRSTVSKSIRKSNQYVNDNILSYNYSYPLHRAYKRPKFNPYLNIRSPKQQIQCDLLDIALLKKYNDNTAFLLVCVDCFSRFLWAIPLKNKTSEQMENAFKTLIEMWQPELPKQLSFDQGTEFRNKRVQTLLRNHNIKVFHPTATGKAVYVERCIQSLKTLINKYLTEKTTQRYIDVLQSLVKTYNNRPHRSLRFNRPIDAVRDENVSFFRRVEQNRIHPIIDKNLKRKGKLFKPGQVVRIKKWKKVFDRGYKQQFSREYYVINKIFDHLPTTTYELKSMHDNEIIQGGFYSNELQLIKGDVYKIEKILKSRKRNNILEHYVKWLDFSSQHNSWIKASDIQ